MKKPIIVFLIFSFFISLTAFSFTQKDISISSEEIEEMASMYNFEKQTQESIEQSNLLIKDGKLAQAREELSSTLNLIKQRILSYENKAKGFISENREDIAKTYNRRASALSDMQGRITQSLQKIAAFEEEAAVKNVQKESDYYTTQGFKYLKFGDFANAKTNFEKAIDITPDNRKAKDGLTRTEKERSIAQRVSELLRQARDNINIASFDEAQKQLREVLRLDPGNSKANDYLAEIEKEEPKEKPLEAEAKTEIVKEERLEAEAKTGIKKEERVEAEEVAKEKRLEAEAKEMALMQDFEKQTQESIEQSDLLIRDGKLAQAKKELSSTLNLVKQRILSYENKAKSLISEKRENTAKIYYKGASTLSNMEGRIGQLLEKIAVLEKEAAVKNAQKESDDYTTQGFEYLKSGDYVNAKTNFEKAIDITPDNRKAEEGLARAEKERVRSVAQRVSELLRQAHNNINTKAFDEAQKQLQEVLRLDPGNSKAKDYLAEIKKEERVEAEEVAKEKRLEAEAKEMALMQDFEKQTRKSIEQSNLLIRDGKLAQAKKELSSTLNLVKQRILSYENKAKSLISEKRENVAKVYSRRASTLGNMEGRIGQLLEKITVLEVDKAGITIYDRKPQQKSDEFIGNSLMVKNRELKYKQLEESIRKSIERSKVLLEKTE